MSLLSWELHRVTAQPHTQNETRMNTIEISWLNFYRVNTRGCSIYGMSPAPRMWQIWWEESIKFKRTQTLNCCADHSLIQVHTKQDKPQNGSSVWERFLMGWVYTRLSMEELCGMELLRAAFCSSRPCWSPCCVYKREKRWTEAFLPDPDKAYTSSVCICILGESWLEPWAVYSSMTIFFSINSIFMGETNFAQSINHFYAKVQPTQTGFMIGRGRLILTWNSV